MMKKIHLLLAFVTLFAMAASCESTSESTVVETPYYGEKYRPQIHFSPEEKWMNDPNGMVYYDGEYHLFYQYYPDSTVWGPMHWGHAISTDLVHWEHLPIALYPDELGLIFSGSAVIDWNNSSGLQEGEHPPMIAIFTQHLMAGEKDGKDDFQVQSIAYSNDKGRNWKMYDGNPVIPNPNIRDFRDPKVFWHKASQQWVMIFAAGDRVRLYNSPNLIDWTYQSEFGAELGAHGGVWECPDLFQLKTETGESHWVMLVSINPGGPNGGSATQYFIGDFDGKRFSTSQKEVKWLDYGRDNYAGVTWSDVPEDDGRRLFIGWMSNWDYARDTPTENWRSAMTLPRSLALKKIEEDYVLTNTPLKNLNLLAKSVLSRGPKVEPLQKEILYQDGLQQSKISFSTLSGEFNIKLQNEEGEFVELTMDKTNNAFLLDRMNSGKVDFQSEFGNKKHYMPIDYLGDTPVEITIMVDWSSIEVFLNNGLYTMTQQIFPTTPYNQLVMENKSKEFAIEDLVVEKMESIWD